MSDEATWKAVDHYIGERLLPVDPVLESALEANTAGGLPPMDVSPAQGALLHLMVRMSGARKILEVGTLGGYSTIWMARGMPPGGRLISLEYQEKHAEVARANLHRAGLDGVAEVRVGRALDILPTLQPEAPFDFVFIDADKPGNRQYIDWALKLSRPGTVIVVDNVIRDGKVIQTQSNDMSVQGSRAAFDRVGGEGRMTATALQTVGAKGYDGFMVAIVS